MKTLHTIYTNFAKRVLMALALITMGVGTAWGDTWTWTASNQNELGTSTSYSATLNDKTWSVKRSSVQHTGMTNDCIQLGKSGGAETVTLESSAFEGTINSVSVECASYNGAHKITISVGGTEYLSASTSSWQTVSSKKGEGDSSGQIQIKFTAGNGARALYIKSITVEYNAGGNQPDPEEPDEDLCGWVETDISKISSTDVVVITMNNGNTYAMSNDNGTSSPPSAVKVTVSDDKTLLETDDDKIADNIKWNVSNDNGTLTIYPNGNNDIWLYCNNSNNGVRVGTNANKTFEIDANSGYLFHNGTSRYIGVYNSQDWRCYTPIHSNIENQTLKFYKYVPCGPTETTITFDSNGGVGGPSPVTATKDEEMPSIASSLPSRTGHTLKGYYDAESGGTKYYNADGTSAKAWDKDDAEYTLYAQWTAQQYNIIYNDQGNVDFSGSHEEGYPTKHTYGTATTLKDATKTGYTFGDWYTNSACTGDPITQLGATDYTSDITLYAKWTINSYSTRWKLAGGQLNGNSDDIVQDYEFGQAITAPTGIERVGFNFIGWEPTVPTTMPAENLEFTAQWEEKQLTNFRTLCEYTVTWELAGGQIDGNTDDIVDTYTNGQEIQKPADPTREGYRFLGWSPDFVEGTKMQSQSLVYTAQWFELVVTTLQWSEDYYTATMEADNDFPDLTILPNDFAGELTYQSSNSAVATIADDGTITLIGTGTTTITASIAADDTYLAASDSYELTVAASNCKWVEVTDNTTLEDGDEVVITMGKGGLTYALPNAKRITSDPAPSAIDVTTNIVGNEMTSVANNIKWTIERVDDYYVFYTISNEGRYNLYCNSSDNGVCVAGSGNALTNHKFSIEGHYLKSIEEFRYFVISFNTTPYTWRSPINNTTTAFSGQTLKFYKRECLDSEHYWLTWDATDGQFADGSKQIVKDYAVGTTINKPFDPTRTGYDFAGWSTDGVNVVTPAEKMPEENLSYSAVWQIKSYTVTWDADGGQFANGETVIEQTYEYGATITKPANPTRTGYTFKGWSPNVPDKMSTDNLKFVAQWQVNQYTVTWDPGEGGHWGNSFDPIVENYNYGAPINKPANPEKAGYVFDKWEPDVVATMPNNNLTYTAKWNEAFCDAFTFHTGDADVWNNPQEQICFEYKANHEWQIINYVIPISDAQSHFLVADRGWPQIDQGSLGGHSKSATSTWSATMYLAPSMDSNDGNGSPKVGHAKGAVGTLRIFDDSNWDNLYVGFIPNGYKLKFGANEYDFEHYEDAEYRSEIVEYNATTANNNVSVGVINTSNAYVKTDHTQEGMRHIFLKVNSNWKSDGAKFAIYYFNSNSDNGWSNFMKEVPGETDMYEGWIPENYSKVIFVRLNPDGGINWDAKWNQTGNLTLQTDKTLYTIPSGTWDNADDKNWSTYTRHGKFRIYNDSWDKNWYVHFYPHYVITFDKNATDATGTMPPQALPLDANPMTMVLNECAFKRRGYDFTGWKTNVAITADGADVAANGNVKDKATISNINKDITLTAQWKAQAYTITYKDQGDVAYSGENLASLPNTHTYDQTTTLVAGVKTGYTFGGWYLTPECDGTAVTELGAQDYTTNITLYAKWTFAMEYNITNTETIFITSAKGQTIKAATQLTLQVSNMPVGTTIALSAPNIKFYFGDEEIKQLTNKYVSETFSLTIAYTPTADDTTEQPTITLSVLGNEKTFDGLISARSLPANFVIAAKWGNNWYAMPANMDSQSSTEGLLIEVDNPSDPIKALAAPNTTKYGLKSVYTSNSSADRYAANGNRLVFVEDVTEATPITNKTLYNGGDGSSSKTNIQVYAQYTGYYTNNPDRYEWIPTTTDLKDYTLTSAAVLAGDVIGRTVSLDNHGIFGTLLQDKSYNGMVRLLPVDNFYEPIELQVVEWKQNSVSVMYTGAGTKYTTQVGNNAESSVLAAIDHAVYSLSTADLTTTTNQPLIITIKDDADAIIGAVKLTIPAIVATDKSSTALGVTKENAKATNIVILDGATLTAGITKYTYNDVVVYPGGNLVIDTDGKLGMYTLTLRAGSSWGAAEYEHKYPQFLLKGDYSNSSGQINLDYVTTQDYYYPLSVPEKVTIDDIKYPMDIYGSNVDKANTGSFRLKYYDGKQRVKQGSQYGTGWVVVDENTITTLTPNQGYAIWGIPKKINGTRQTYGIHRIPMKIAAGTLATNEKENAEVEITAHGDASTPPNDRGWNYLGNPYLAGLGTNDDTDVQMGLLVQEMIDGKWTGGWVNNGEQVRYVTLTKDCQNFEALPVSEATILPFTTFFVQAAQTGAIALNAPTAVAAPASVVARRYAAQQEAAKEITTGIILTGNDQTDRTGLLIADNFTEEYDFNADLSKFENSGINLYTIGKTGNLAYMAINQALAEQPIPVGYTAPAEGLYTIAFDEDRYNVTDISALYLIDYDSNEKTNLLHTDYSFVTAAGTNNQRFALQVAFAPENATNIEWVGDATVQVGVEGNTLMLNNLPTDAAVHVFDALGRLMYHAPTVPTEMQLTLPTGYYLVRIADKQNAVVIKTVIP